MDKEESQRGRADHMRAVNTSGLIDLIGVKS